MDVQKGLKTKLTSEFISTSSNFHRSLPEWETCPTRENNTSSFNVGDACIEPSMTPLVEGAVCDLSLVCLDISHGEQFYMQSP